MQKDELIIYTDGSSLGNPGAGGWGSVLITPDGKVIELGGREKESTNNRMEMTAALEALKLVEKRKIKAKSIVIHTDSTYLLNGITIWVYAWVRNNWKTKTKDSVLNKDLWEELYKVVSNLKNKYEIDWIKVSGHSGVHLNERCDEIATGFSSQSHPLLFIGSLKEYERLFGKIDSKKKTDFKAVKNKTVKKSSKSKDTYTYVSCVDGKVFSDKTWVLCEKRVKGKSGAKYKKVFSKEEEQDLIALWSLKSLQSLF